MDRAGFEAEADRLVAAADQAAVTLRVLGALAFKRQCPNHAYLQDAPGREYTDIDFAGYGKQVKQIRRVLGGAAYGEDGMVYVESEGNRLILNHPRTALHLDVFLDKLAFCHTIPFAGRLEVDPYTIPLAEMLM